MKRIFLIIALLVGMSAFAGNNPTNPNSSSKNQYPSGGKSTSKEIREDQVNRNYKQQGTLEVNAPVDGNVKKAKNTNGNYKAPFGL